MRGRNLGLLAVTFCCGVAIQPRTSGGGPVGSGELPQKVSEAIDAYMGREMTGRRIPGAAVIVVRNGVVTYRGAYGSANLETDAPVSTSSVFELASVTKPFTAAATMLLVEDGALKLDDPVSAHIQDAPAAWRDVRIQHLLSHTAGFPEEVVVGCHGSPVLNVRTAQQFEAITRAPLLFAPGEHAAYSDPGYFLLGVVIERASGMRYRDFMQRRIFGPLHMTRTSVLDQTAITKGRVAPYAIRMGALVRARRDWQHELASHFGVWSTVEDLARFEVALASGALLDPASLARMWTPAQTTTGHAMISDGQYGFGWRLSDHRGHRTIEHGGFSGTHFLRVPDARITVAVLTNLDVASGSRPDGLARAVAGLVEPRLTAPEMLEPRTDPAPETTRRVLDAVRSLAADRPAPLVTPEYRELLRRLPPTVGQRTLAPFADAAGLTYLGGDEITWDLRRVRSAVARTSYYLIEGSNSSSMLSVWMTRDGRIADLRVAPR